MGSVRLACTLYGPEGGDAVVVLHGFPECGKTWRRVAMRLAREGYRVVAPDMRGYGGSERPAGVGAYAVRHLVEDVAGLVRALGLERAHVVGHDWGGVVAWWTAMLRPDVVARLGIVNAPHPVAYARALRTADQLRRSWYVFAFQVPWLAEWALASRSYAAVRRVFADDGIGEDDIEPCVAAIREPGACTAALAYYRAAFRAGVLGSEPAPEVIHLPTLAVWGERDRFLVPSLGEPPREWVDSARVVRLPQATHWAQLDSPADLARELLAHFRA